MFNLRLEYDLRAFSIFSVFVFACNNGMNVIGTHMRGEQGPAAMCANLLEGFQHGGPAVFVQKIWRLVQTVPRERRAVPVGVERRTSELIIVAVNGASLVAVQMRAIAGERYEKDQILGRSLTVAAPLGDYFTAMVVTMRPVGPRLLWMS